MQTKVTPMRAEFCAAASDRGAANYDSPALRPPFNMKGDPFKWNTQVMAKHANFRPRCPRTSPRRKSFLNF